MSAPMTFNFWRKEKGITSVSGKLYAKLGFDARQPEIDSLHAVNEALKAQIAELEQENFRLAAGQCVHQNGIIGSDGGVPLCPITCTTDSDSKHVTAMKGQS